MQPTIQSIPQTNGIRPRRDRRPSSTLPSGTLSADYQAHDVSLAPVATIDKPKLSEKRSNKTSIALPVKTIKIEAISPALGPTTPPKQSSNGSVKTGYKLPPSGHVPTSPIAERHVPTSTPPSSSLKIRLPARNIERNGTATTDTTQPATSDTLPSAVSVSASTKSSRPRRTARDSPVNPLPTRPTRSRRKSTRSLQAEGDATTI
jgi:hypothetical protein